MGISSRQDVLACSGSRLSVISVLGQYHLHLQVKAKRRATETSSEADGPRLSSTVGKFTA